MAQSPSTLVNATRQKDALTANGAVTNSTSLSHCVDMFFLAGATRSWSDNQIIELFTKAHAEDPRLAYLILFWARDCRGGAGEKRFFRVICKHMLSHPLLVSDFINFLKIIHEIGSWKDIFEIADPDTNEELFNFMLVQMKKNLSTAWRSADSCHKLLCKYFPRKGPWFAAMHKALGKTPFVLRKYLVANSDVVEHKICSKSFSYIDYSKVPSQAMNKYRDVFVRWDRQRYNKYLESIEKGESKINAATLFPHQLIQALEKIWHTTRREDDAVTKLKSVFAQWDALPDYMGDSTERILPVCDVSGSMRGLPMDVSVALGLYISERNKGIFKDAVLTFSANPQMHYVQGNNLLERFKSLSGASWGMNTDLQATFDLILTRALEENLPQEEMPTKLLIISDMEFDVATKGGTNLDLIKTKYKESGYDMPEIIFWNVNGRLGNIPAECDDANTGLVSGFSPAILTAILKGEVVSPEQLMLTAVTADRYVDLLTHCTRD